MRLVVDLVIEKSRKLNSLNLNEEKTHGKTSDICTFFLCTHGCKLIISMCIPSSIYAYMDAGSGVGDIIIA